MSTTREPTIVERLRERLGTRTRAAIDRPDAVACAVLVAITPGLDDHTVLYTLRSESLPSHRGQVSFPGGKQHAEDATLRDTALRESHEEIGLAPDEVEVLGRLDDVYTMATEYVITPFVGLVPAGYEFSANPGEVSEIFTLEFGELMNPDHHGHESQEYRGHAFTVDLISAGPHKIWGATHRITINLLEVLRGLGRTR